MQKLNQNLQYFQQKRLQEYKEVEKLGANIAVIVEQLETTSVQNKYKRQEQFEKLIAEANQRYETCKKKQEVMMQSLNEKLQFTQEDLKAANDEVEKLEATIAVIATHHKKDREKKLREKKVQLTEQMEYAGKLMELVSTTKT